jgi:hypothetical protein
VNTIAEFIENQFYHVYNRTNNKELLFKKRGNQAFFLARYKKYLSPFVKTHAYALLGTHYHFSIQVKSFKEILNFISDLHRDRRTVTMNNLLNNTDSKKDLINKLIINQFQNFQVSYAKSINKQFGRNGSLFQKKFKRSVFDPEIKFRYLQYYIHHNARKHGLVNEFRDYPYHSYDEIISGSSSIIDFDKVIELFGCIEEFKKFHNEVHLEERFTSLD